MKKKRLLIDANSILNYVKNGFVYGVGRTTFELIKALDKHIDNIPFEIVLYTQNTKRITIKELFNFPSFHLLWPNRDRYKKLLFLFGLKKKLVRYDLMHIPHNIDDTLNDVSNTIFTIHDVIVFRYPQYWGLTEEKRNQLITVAQQCKAIVTCSECSKQDIVKFLNVPAEKVTSIPWGINREMFHPIHDNQYIDSIGINGLYYFTSSANHARKNLTLLLESYKEYLNSGGKGQLVILNPEKERLVGFEDLIEKRQIIILNKISDKELAILYTHAQCSLMLTSYEGFGLPVLESLACGTQVISAYNSSLIEAGGDIVDFIGDLDKHTIAKKLLSYDNKDKVTILDNGKLEKHLQKFSWGECAKKYIEFYKRVLEIS